MRRPAHGPTTFIPPWDWASLLARGVGTPAIVRIGPSRGPSRPRHTASSFFHFVILRLTTSSIVARACLTQILVWSTFQLKCKYKYIQVQDSPFSKLAWARPCS